MSTNIDRPATVRTVRARGNVEFGNCDNPPNTTLESTPQASESSREEADEYRGFIADLNSDWRVVGCRAAVQWVLQHRAGQRHGARRWASIGFHRSRQTLKAAVHGRCGEVTPEAAAIIEALPEWFE